MSDIPRIFTTPPDSFEAQAHACCCFIHHANQLLFLRKTRLWPGKWCAPGGKVDTPETSLMAIKREVLEETGLLIPETYLVSKGSLFIHNSWGQYQLDCFEAHFAERPGIILNDEHDRSCWVSTEEELLLETIPAQKEVLRQIYPSFRI